MIKQLRKAYSHARGLKCLPNVKYRKVSFQKLSEQGHGRVFHLPLAHRVGGIPEGVSHTTLFPTTVRDKHMKTLVASATFYGFIEKQSW